MSDVQNTTTAQPAEAVAEKVMTNPTPAAPTEETTATEAPATTESAVEAPKTEETAAPATTEEKAEEKTDAATPATETKVAEPILEGQLGYKAPGLLKQFTFSKKEFWLNDAAVTPQNLGLFLRGEKSEVSHPITAWASQTGKGLLFFNKKGESDRTQPAGVIALYDATDLKKAAPHEFTFDISGHKHSFKATSDAERDGWYQSIEKAIELGKASKESVRDSEGYKAELEKLNTPTTGAGAVGAAKTRSQSQPKKSIDADQAEAKRAGSSDGEEEEAKKANKSRSTSRGMFNRLKGKKEEADVKKEEKKEEKEAVKEEKAAEKEEKKAEETTPVAAAATTSETPAETTTAEPAAATTAPAEEKPIEALPAAETKPEEKTRTNKRSSIFGKIPGAWSLKSPNKEKSEKEAELKPEVPAKDAAVSDAPPQLPETAATEPIETPVAGESTKPEITETAPEAKAAETATPNKEKKNFLSGLSFMNKRDRSVSPSAATKEQPTKTETAPAVPAKDETPAAEPVKTEEPTTEAAAPATTETADKPAEKVEEPKSADATSPNGNKRTSMLGSLGRRASKAFNRMQAPKKENAAPAAEKTTEEPAVEKKPEETTSTEPAATTATAPETIAERATETPAVASTEENKPENVVNQPTPVAASA